MAVRSVWAEVVDQLTPAFGSLLRREKDCDIIAADRTPDLRVAAGDSDGAFTKLAQEYLSFVDPHREHDETFNLYGEVPR